MKKCKSKKTNPLASAHQESWNEMIKSSEAKGESYQNDIFKYNLEHPSDKIGDQ
jgi:hypothetical protein